MVNAIVTRIKRIEEQRLDSEGKPYIYVQYVLAATSENDEPIPKFIWYWFKRYAKEIGEYRIREFHGLLCDYEIVSPSDKRFMIKKPGRNNNKLIEKLSKDYDNGK